MWHSRLRCHSVLRKMNVGCFWPKEGEILFIFEMKKKPTVTTSWEWGGGAMPSVARPGSQVLAGNAGQALRRLPQLLLQRHVEGVGARRRAVGDGLEVLAADALRLDGQGEGSGGRGCYAGVCDRVIRNL